MAKFTPRFPRNAKDGQEVADKYGNVWRYYSSTDTWVSIGYLQPPIIVDEKNDGFVSPEIYKRIQYYKNFKEALNQAPLKILPGRGAYYYYFRSNNRLIKFKAESKSQLRIEINMQRLYRLLYNERCKGPTGQRGLIGAAGVDGLAAPAELSFNPTFDNNTLSFAVYTPQPLAAGGKIYLPNGHVPDISVRLDELDPSFAPSLLPSYVELPIYFLTINNEYEEYMRLQADIRNKCAAGNDQFYFCLNDVIKNLDLDSINAQSVLEIKIDPTGEIPVRFSGELSALIDEAASAALIGYNKEYHIAYGKIVLKVGAWNTNYAVKSRQCGPDGARGDIGSSKLSVSEVAIEAGGSVLAKKTSHWFKV